LIRAPLSVTSVLDESTEVVTQTAAPWAGLLIATAIPYRFLQALFLDQLMEVGASAAQYGNLLGGTANLTVLAIVLALWGRAVYARACRIALGRGAAPGREAWRVPAPALASYFMTASALMMVGYLSLFTCLGIIVAIMFSGLAIGTMELNERVSIRAPFRLLFRYASTVRIPAALIFVFFVAMLVALFNLLATFGLLQWAAGALGGFDAPRWQRLFSEENRRFVLLLLAGALIAIEPFWIAAHVVFVRKAGAQESGDDLRAWFDELRRAES
jgi:hypothetical protein